MAALDRPTEATYTTHEEVTVDTEDREDHTFCGIMFPIKCKSLLPLDHVVIQSVAVRGRLGPITVWVSKEEESPQAGQQRQGFSMNPRHWTKVYERTHQESYHEYETLDLRSSHIKLAPGQTRAIYIHSSAPGDEAIVYDNQRSRRTYDDSIVSILTGRAHVSTRPFGTSPIWGWGNPWRDHREFVGRVEYGAVYRLWNPHEFYNFGDKFQTAARTLFLMQRRWESPFSMLPDECIFYILNMCRWNWFADTGSGMKAMKKKQKKREAAAAAAMMRIQQEQNLQMQDTTTAEETEEGVARRDDASASEDEEGGMSCCNRRSHDESESNSNGHEEYHAAREEETFDDDDDEEYVEEIEEDEEEEDDDEEEWDSDDGYGANHELFAVDDDDSDSDEDDTEADTNRNGGRAWIHRQWARIHVLQALAALDDNGVEQMNH